MNARVGELGSDTKAAMYVLEGVLRLQFAGSEDLLQSGDIAVLSTVGTGVWAAGKLSTPGCLFIQIDAS